MEPIETESGVCAGFREDLNLLATGALPADEAARARTHLESCPACREYFDTQREVWELAKKESEAVPPLNTAVVLGKVKRQISAPLPEGDDRGEQLTERKKNWWGVGTGLGLAAALAAALWFMNYKHDAANDQTSSSNPSHPALNPATKNDVPGTRTPATNPGGNAVPQGLSLAMQITYDNLGRPQLGTLQVRNGGTEEIAIAGYHPLASNYELELHRPGQSQGEFVRLSPRALRKFSLNVSFESVEPTKSAVKLMPGEIYAIEFELSPLMKDSGEYRLMAHYLGFESNAPVGETARAGFTLHSAEVKFELPSATFLKK